jgi:general secretion pathway protein G
MEDPGQSVDQNNPGLWDVKSGSDKMSLEGTPYSDW